MRSGSRWRAVTRFVVVFFLFALSSETWAGEREDNAAIATIDKVLANDVANANFGEAKKKLRTVIDRCKKCSPAVVGRAYIAVGIVASQIGQAEEAKTAWNDALNVDPNAALPNAGVSQQVRTHFEQAQKAWLASNPQLDDAQKAGWVNRQAFDLWKAALAAESAGNFQECIEKDKGALTLEENMRARLHLAMCESKTGKIVDAMRDNAKVLEMARSKGDAATIKQVQERVAELVPRLGHVKFEVPQGVSDLRVTFDGRPIPPERINDSFTIDPGTHVAHAEGVLRGVRVSFDDNKVEVPEGGAAIVSIKLKPAALTQGQLECMVAAKTQEEIAACLPQEGKPLVVNAALDVSGYLDSAAVHVLTPSVRGAVSSPTAGWNVGASYLVDVLTAASPDVVSTASRRFYDIRHAASVTGGFKPGRFGGQIYGSFSSERDYTSRTVGGTATGDFMDKQLAPQIGFAHTWDTIGRTGTDTDVFGKPFASEEISAGATVVMSPTSLIVLGGSVALEHGDQSKPYRYIPLFEPGVSVPVGASVDEVNSARLPVKPLEQLPTSRQRFALAGRYVARVKGTATLRLEERLYNDTWAIRASTTDAKYLMDLSPRLRVWPHGHLHVQTGASFYSRIYGATLNSDGSATIPQYRTSDRELSPMAGLTLGGGARYTLTDPAGKIQIALFTNADFLFNYYFNSLYLKTRYGGYGTLGIEADFE